jgi:microcystin degradation protein MlrC
MKTLRTALVGGIAHESSTFATAVTGLLPYGKFSVFTGQELLTEFTGTNTCIGGYLAACADAGVVPVPILHARAEPAGEIREEAYRSLEERFIVGMPPRTGADRLVLLDLHGAGVIEHGGSLEERLLREVRAAVGNAATIAVTLDLHGNVPAALPELADVIVGFHEYPHVDMAARAARAARIGIAAAHGVACPHTSQLSLPMVLPPTPTDHGCGARLRDLARAAEQRPGVLACTVFHGFPYADTTQAGASIVTVTDDAPGLGAAVNEELANWLWRHRSSFLIEPCTPEQVLSRARPGAGGPVIIGEAADNPGAGAPGDGTYLLRAMMNSGLRACFATLHDPRAIERVAEAGVDTTLELALGGRHDVFSGPPIPVRATVRAVADGRVVQRSMRRGKHTDFGLCALLSIDNVELIIAADRVQVTDPAIFARFGIRPAEFEVVAVKSASHFRSGFAGIGSELLVTDTPGLTTRQIECLERAGPSGKLWPADLGVER